MLRASKGLPPEGGYLDSLMWLGLSTVHVGVSTPDFDFETHPSAAQWQM